MGGTWNSSIILINADAVVFINNVAQKCTLEIKSNFVGIMDFIGSDSLGGILASLTQVQESVHDSSIIVKVGTRYPEVFAGDRNVIFMKFLPQIYDPRVT